MADGSLAIEEVGDLMMQINADNEKKTVLEAQQKYREVVASQYAAGVEDAEEKLKPIIEEQKAVIAEKDATIAKLQEQLAKNGITLDL